MRPIKFRAWDEENAQMVYSDVQNDWYIFGFERGKIGCWLSFVARATLEEPEHLDLAELHTPLMQFTGLLDNDGREIYEGDVVRSDDGVGEVKIDHGSTWTDYGGRGSNLDVDLCQGRTIVVIGNAYENPELVKK